MLTKTVKCLVLIAVMTLHGCNSAGDHDSSTSRPKASETLTYLTELEETLNQSLEEMNTPFADSVAEAFTNFSRNYPEHEQAPMFLFKAAEIRVNQTGKALFGVVLFQELIERFPESKLAPNALFMIPMTFDAVLGDDTRALKGYREFLNQYPDHEFASEARNLLHLIESSPDDLSKVKEWLKNADSLTN
ncbi:MAG: tetratricopeptide repeat protein [Schleiferiaceae bacterium]|nr:tetratricopeptide repeat protein [Schleiferiaceae bacterium]